MLVLIRGSWLLPTHLRLSHDDLYGPSAILQDRPPSTFARRHTVNHGSLFPQPMDSMIASRLHDLVIAMIWRAMGHGAETPTRNG